MKEEIKYCIAHRYYAVGKYEKPIQERYIAFVGFRNLGYGFKVIYK